MRQRGDLQEFISRCNRVTDIDELKRIIEDITQELGFDYVALTHHVDLLALPEDAISLTNYPVSWLDQFYSCRYFEDDPIHTASVRTAVGFRWSDVPKLIDLTPRQRAIMDGARREGVCDGFTVPVHVPGEYRGTISFAAGSLGVPRGDVLAAAQLLGAFAFEAGRRIIRQRRPLEGRSEVPKLSDRQLECITLAGQGKTDWEIGAILGISRSTVGEYLEAARRRYDVVSRTQLVIRALFDGHISFSSLIGRSSTPEGSGMARRPRL